jgi:hypothetical protein
MLGDFRRPNKRFFVPWCLLITASLIFLVAPLPGLSQTAKETSNPKPPTDLLQNIFDGLAQGDFFKYSSEFSPVMKEAQTRESFLDLQKKIQKSLGKVRTINYLGYYVQKGNYIHLFKGHFTKEKDDVLVKLVLDSNKPSALVTGLWLDSPALEK